MHIKILDVIVLSFYLVPNIITVITPFIIIFGLLLCFIKLNKDNELISILSLGLGLKPFRNTLFFFSFIIVVIFMILNLYVAPKIYEKYKVNEYNLRNTLDLNNIAFSNFINLNKTTILDFKKTEDGYKDIFISFSDEKDNIVYAKKGNIFSKNDQYNFKLIEGFKISIDKQKQVEKLEFLNYVLKIESSEINNREIVDNNTLTIFDDLKSKNYLNLTFKIIDIILILYVIIFFFSNNLKKINFKTTNNIYYASISISILILNQIFKNSEMLLNNYIFLIGLVIIFSFFLSNIKKKYE